MTTTHTAPSLLLHGHPSPATTFLLVHHGLRRDLGRFLTRLRDDTPLPDAGRLRDAWRDYRTILDGHHDLEDTLLFPHLVALQPDVAVHVTTLAAQHDRLHGLLDAVDAGMDLLVATGARGEVLQALSALADLVTTHLAAEEDHLVPLIIRHGAAAGHPGDRPDPRRAIPWALDGVAPDVAAVIVQTVPPPLRTNVADWLAAAAAERDALWGPLPPAAATTSIPG